MGKMGSMCHFPRAVPASIRGHCSQVQVLVFTGIFASAFYAGASDGIAPRQLLAAQVRAQIT